MHLTVTELLERDDILRVDSGSHRAQTHTSRNLAVLGLGTALFGSLLAPGVASANATPAPIAAPAPATAVQQSSDTYTVVRGDTLSKIGAKTGISWRTIADVNGISSPYVIRVGQVLKLSGSGGNTTVVVEEQSQNTPVPAPAPSTSKGETAVAFALQQIKEGDRYVYGANGPSSWDCSSFTQAAWRSAGVSIPRTSGQQAGAGVATTRAALVPGDLVTWSGHVAMYAGNGQIVHAVNAKHGLRVTTIEWMGRAPTGYRHID